MLADVLTAQQALALGLLNQVLLAGELLPTAMQLAARIAQGPLVAYRYMKQNVQAASAESYESLLDREAFTQRLDQRHRRPPRGPGRVHRKARAEFQRPLRPRSGRRELGAELGALARGVRRRSLRSACPQT